MSQLCSLSITEPGKAVVGSVRQPAWQIEGIQLDGANGPGYLY